MNYLKQSTAATLKLGPFIDDADGKTAETGLTIAQADVRLSKNGADIAQKNDATSATHDELGIYGVPVNTTDTNTVGILQVFIAKTGALPVWAEYFVLPANVYDALAGSDYLQVDAVEVSGDAAAANNLESDYDGTGYNKSASTIGTVSALTGHTPQTGDSYARIGANGAGLTTLATAAALATVDTVADAIKAKTDNLPADPAGVSNLPAAAPTTAEIWSAAGRELSTPNNYKADVSALATAASIAALNDPTPAEIWAAATRTLTDPNSYKADVSGLATAAALATVDTVADAIKAKTDNLPADPAGVSNLPAAAPTTAEIWSAAGRELSTPNNYKADVSALATAASIAALNDPTPAEIWAAATRTLTDPNSYKADVSALATAAALAAQNDLSSAEVAAAVLDALLADHNDVGSVGEGIAAAGSAGDPWSTQLPGAYGAGSAGNILGNMTGGDLTAADIWAYATRTLTDPNSYKADVSALATAAALAAQNDITAAEVWQYATRELSNPNNYKANVSGLATSAEIAALNDPTPAEIWAAATRTLTDPNSYKADISGLATLASIAALNDPTPAEIWAAPSRSLSTPNDYKADVSGLATSAEIAALNNLSSGELDAALNQYINVNSIPEPVEPLPSGATLAESIAWLRAFTRNQLTQNDSTQTLYAENSATPIARATVIYDGETFTRGKFVNP